jgi:hypothetical protein
MRFGRNVQAAQAGVAEEFGRPGDLGQGPQMACAGLGPLLPTVVTAKRGLRTVALGQEPKTSA